MKTKSAQRSRPLCSLSRGPSCRCAPSTGRWNPPVAEIMVYSYGRLHDFSPASFSALAYTKGKVKNKWMQVCTVINGIYAVGAAAIIGMSIVTLL